MSELSYFMLKTRFLATIMTAPEAANDLTALE